MNKEYKIHYKSKLGLVQITSSEDAVIGVEFVGEGTDTLEIPPILKEAYAQIDEYFKGVRKDFDLKLYIEGTDFQKKVWEQLRQIPYGEISTYKEVAKAIGNEKAVRAVGNSNNKNKIPIIIPCHRVIGSNGKLVGYAGGLHIKQWLLEHEKSNFR